MYINNFNKNNRIVFLTGTRADYGKMKSLIKAVEESGKFEAYIFATGMHMLSKYGSTYKEIIKDGFKNIFQYINQGNNNNMDITLSNTIIGFSNYIAEIRPQAIVVHGDRLEALAGAIVGAFNNIRVFHIEGGEVSGTIDESIRHAITKFSHYHLVANEAAKKRIIQLGEPEDRIYVFGSPDIDIMHSSTLPTLDQIFKHYEIPFDKGNYGIFIYHPVTTELPYIKEHIHNTVKALVKSDKNFVFVYPNNDSGSDIILEEYNLIKDNPHFRIFPSMRFESFLTLLKNADVIIGNSSSGIREASIYGIPAIDIGTRQEGRYNIEQSPHIMHVDENQYDILKALDSIKGMNLEPQSYFGLGDSNKLFLDIISNKNIWTSPIQKRFIDVDF